MIGVEDYKEMAKRYGQGTKFLLVVAVVTEYGNCDRDDILMIEALDDLAFFDKDDKLPICSNATRTYNNCPLKTLERVVSCIKNFI